MNKTGAVIRRKKLDGLIGQRQIRGRLTAKKFAERYRKPSGGLVYKLECLCDCGNTVLVDSVKFSTEHTRSCGCLKAEEASERRKTHGMSSNGLYSVWANMIARCEDSSREEYKHYGARGITVCERWRGENGFVNFSEDVSPRPPGTTLDRRENGAGYSKENCRWVTQKTQMRNMRANRIVEYGGQARCISEWAEVTGLARHVIEYRINAGWSTERALTTPKMERAA